MLYNHCNTNIKYKQVRCTYRYFRPVFHLAIESDFLVLASLCVCVFQLHTRLMELSGYVYIYAIYLVSLFKFATRLLRNSLRHLLSTHFHTNLTDSLRFASALSADRIHFRVAFPVSCAPTSSSLSLSLFPYPSS